MDKIVTSGESNCYVTLTESNECAVKFDRTYRMFAVNNTSENEAIMSLSPNKSRTDDGVRIIPAGESRTLTTSGIDSDTVYINGNGSVEVAALNGNSVNPFFKGSSGGGGGGSSYIPNSEKGAAGGVATLDISGKVPAGQLPSYVDDVIDGYYYESSFYADSEHTQLIVGETGKIYNDVSTNISYRWNGTGYTAMSVQNAVTYTSQALTTEQKTQARENIGAAASDDIPTDAVKYTAQTLTTEQKTQARTNIGAGTSNFSGNYDDLDNAPDMTFIQPEISDMVDSGLGWRAQQAYYTDTAGNPQYYAQCLSYTDAYNGGYSLKINNGPSICAFIRDPNLIWGIYLLSTVESAAVINYAESRSSPVETISPVASNSWYIAGKIIDIGDYAPGKKRNYPDIVLPSDSTFRNADFGTDAATRAEAVRIILEAAHAIPPTSFNVPTVECTEQRYANAVKYTAQTLTDAQKSQARTNIGAAASTDAVQSDWAQSNSSENDFIKNKPPIRNGHGTGGNLEGGTNAYATYSNSIAYGNGANAIADYAVAIGQSLNAAHSNEVAFGKFNMSNADTAFSIGDGTGTGATPNHNLMELKTDGRLLLNDVAVASEKEISELYAILGLYGNDVYGFQVDFENYIYTRLASAVGKTPGTDFDSLAPWSGMRRCNLADDGTVNAYYGDASYTEDGSNGQVMVEIPKFYYRVMPIKTDPIGGTVGGYHMRKGNYYISATKYEGFKTHPAFIKPDGTEVDKAYVSAYEGSVYDVSESAYILDDAQVADFTATTGDKLCSIAGAKPCSGSSQSLTRINAEQLAVNRGTGWHTLNSKAISAVQMLFVVEYASFNAQPAIGKGVVDKSSGTGNVAVVTGDTSSLGNASGMADGTNGLVSVSYRGIENFWGNIWKFCIDINIYGDRTMRGGIPYICNNYNYTENTTTGYSSAGFTLANAFGYISAFGYNADYDWLFITSETGGTADSAYPIGDYEYVVTNLNGYRISMFGGSWSDELMAGAFFWDMNNAAGIRQRFAGSRLIYV